ncbi:hypothetical protein EKG38_18475 [Shewanella canadensis]|uniref:Periplasmic heavy metal sensor n=1 Tax=Shewanella canadensis TaxID=271096 RepID=A0A431WQI9_9GAMM|nr:hypothetical protein [Shewanella canadensis]RTR37449.1 hypothetical protein EKG38_18475 [Shewanella canadensis]
MTSVKSRLTQFIIIFSFMSGCSSMKELEPVSYNDTEQMIQYLNLTEQQIQSISTINKRYDERLESSGIQSMRILKKLQHKKALQQERNRELKQLLSPQQLALFQQKNRREKAKKAARYM